MFRLTITAITVAMLVQIPVRAEGEGEQLYQAYCTQCHGVSGDGKGINSAQMTVMPRNHSDTAEMSARTDTELFKVIAQGGPSVNKSVLMPAWGGVLSDDEIKQLVSYLRQVCKCGAKP